MRKYNQKLRRDDERHVSAKISFGWALRAMVQWCVTSLAPSAVTDRRFWSRDPKSQKDPIVTRPPGQKIQVERSNMAQENQRGYYERTSHEDVASREVLLCAIDWTSSRTQFSYGVWSKCVPALYARALSPRYIQSSYGSASRFRYATTASCRNTFSRVRWGVIDSGIR